MPQPKKTIEQLKEAGTYRPGTHGIAHVQPTIELGLVAPKDMLNDWGEGLWNDIVGEYAKMGLITKVDVSSLLATCIEWGRYCEANDIVLAQGLQIEESVYNQRGDLVGTKTVTNPMVIVAEKSFKSYLSMVKEFGLSPVSRSRISAPEKQPDDPFDKFD